MKLSRIAGAIALVASLCAVPLASAAPPMELAPGVQLDVPRLPVIHVDAPVLAVATVAAPRDDAPQLQGERAELGAFRPAVFTAPLADVVVPPGEAIPVDTSAKGVFDHFLEAALTPQGIASGVAVIGTVLGLLLGASAVRKRRVALAVYHAFHIVEDIDNERGDDKLDKVRAGLQAADEWMKAHGWRTLKPGEQEVAKLGFKALNGQQALQTKIQADALVASAVASPS